MSAARSHRHLLIAGGTLVTMDRDRRVEQEDLLITDGQIAGIGPGLSVPPATRYLDASGLFVLPGLVQGHVHLGQALFRGLAEERTLLPWLRERIWPLEAAHDEESAYWSTLLGTLDCLLSGTTTVQEIGLVTAMSGVFRGLLDGGLRAVAGKCLMDLGEGAPAGLLESPADGLREAEELNAEWEGRGRGRIEGAVCPRFILSCSSELWEGAVSLASRLDLPMHTHLLESRGEEEAVREALGVSQMEYLHARGVLDGDLRIAHGVWLGRDEFEILGDRSLGVVHCPSSNLKLGSGLADLVLLREQEGIALGLGTDGAPCNNDMDMLEEMRLAALLQAGRHGPGKFRAEEALALATIEGARVLGMDEEIGSLEAGKQGDVVVLDLDRPATFGPESVSVYDRIVYGAGRDAVHWVVVDGEVLVERGEPTHLEIAEVMARAGEEIRRLLGRAELS